MIGAVCAYSSEWKENGHKAAKKRGFYKNTKLKAKSLNKYKMYLFFFFNMIYYNHTGGTGK